MSNIYNNKQTTIVGKKGYPQFQDLNGFAINNGIVGCQDVQVTNNHIYALFNGEKEKEKNINQQGGKYIYMFSLDGVPLKRFTMDRHAIGFFVDEDNQKIYLLDVNSDSPLFSMARHMQKMGLRSKLSKKFRVTTDASHNYKVAPNLLNREFNQEEPMKACVSDITYISCKDGFLYLTCVIDLFDRKLIGWSISDNLTASGTVMPAIRMANRSRSFKEGMIFHSDRGIQYACKQTVNLLRYHRVEQSMSG